MATHANSTPASAVAALQANAIARIEELKTTAQLLAENLRDVMEEIHGGGWRIQIDHDVELVTIVPGRDRTAQPKRGEVV